jgi:hypothetical protein
MGNELRYSYRGSSSCSTSCTSHVTLLTNQVKGPSWRWSYGSWIYLCYQCQSPLMLWVRISIRARCTTLCDKVCQWLETGRWFSSGPPVSSTNKTDCHDITEILLKVALNTIKQTNNTNQVMSHEWDCDYEKHLWHKYFVSLLKMFV